MVPKVTLMPISGQHTGRKENKRLPRQDFMGEGLEGMDILPVTSRGHKFSSWLHVTVREAGEHLKLFWWKRKQVW